MLRAWEGLVAAEAAHRSRPLPLLALGQVRYQLLLLGRNPLAFLLTLVLPVLLLVVLNVMAPGGASADSAQFLTPAMSVFGLLNAGYVTTITGLTVHREEGMLKRLRGTPLPAWTYLAGRLGSTLVTGAFSVTIIVTVGVLFLNVTMVWGALGYFAAAAVLGIVCFFLLGVAVTTVVPKTETALPVAFGTMLPLAFISDVFFSSTMPGWLYDLASAFPVAPVARAMEHCFEPATGSWPMPVSGLLAVLGWSAAAAVVIVLAFRWEPGPAQWRLRWHHPG